MTIILDSLDQLSDHGAGLQDWIPRKIKKNMKMILSAIPEEKFKVVPTLKKFLPEDAFVTIPPLEDTDISEIISSWLEEDNRDLLTQQKDILEVRLHHLCSCCLLELRYL